MTSWNTERAYAGGWAAWCGWAEANGRVVKPASPADVLAFLARSVERGFSYATVKSYRSSIRYEHINAGLPSPTNHEACRFFMLGVPHSPRRRACVRAALLHPTFTLVDRTLLAAVHVADVHPTFLTRLRWQDVRLGVFGVVLQSPGRRLYVRWNRQDPGLCTASMLTLLSVGKQPDELVFGGEPLCRKLLRLAETIGASDILLLKKAARGQPRKTHCVNGHVRSPKSTTSSGGCRACRRTCDLRRKHRRRETQRRRRQRQRESKRALDQSTPHEV